MHCTYISIYRFREESTFQTIQGSVEEAGAREVRGGSARDRLSQRGRYWRISSLRTQTQTQAQAQAHS